VIYIKNISSNEGINQYEIRINNQVICRFEHDKKASGLAQCLRDAADAIEEKRFKDKVEMYYKGFGDKK